MTGSCYWMDGYGNCWTYQQVVDWWTNYYGYAYQENYYDRLNTAMPEQQQQIQDVQNVVQAVEVTKEGITLTWNDILLFASQYWWVGLIFLAGIISLGIAVFRAFSKNKIGSELFKMWGWKK